MATFTGRVTWLSDVQTGTGKSGKAWSKQTAVLTYNNTKPEWPKAVVVSIMNDNIMKFRLSPGECYEMEVDFTAREYKGRYFMEANAWKCIRLADPDDGCPPPVQSPAPASTDDLPF